MEQLTEQPASLLFDLTETSDPRFDRVIEALLVALLTFAPLALGAVQGWSEMVVLCLSTAMGATLALKLLVRRDVPFVWSWTYLPIVVVLLIAAAQLISLPADVAGMISPATVALRRSLLGALPDASQHLARMTLSLYPEATLHDLRLLTAIAVVYVVTVNTIRRAEQVQRLLLAIALIGTAIAFIGVGHMVLGADAIYGIVRGNDVSSWATAPFLNRNHFAQFMNMSLGATVGLLLILADQEIGAYRSASSRKSGRRRRRGSDSGESIAPRIGWLVWALGAAAVLMTLGTFLSVSRGGSGALVISAGIAALIAWRRGLERRMWVLTPLILVASIIICLVAFDLLTQRWSEVAEADSHSTIGRIQMDRYALMGSREFPIAGIGMGSFEVVYPMLDRSNWSSLATHVENEYIQMLLEGGWISLICVLLFAVLILGHHWRCLKSAPSPMALAALGLGIGLIAVMLHSLTDFGQHAPANAALCGVTCGLLVSLSHASRSRAAARPSRNGWLPLRFAAALALVGVMGWLIYDAGMVARAENGWKQASTVARNLNRNRWVGEVDEYQRLLVAATRAAELRPGDVHYAYDLNFYRWKYISQRRDPETGGILYTTQELDWARRIVMELEKTLLAAPTFGPSYLLSGRIQKYVLEDPSAAKLIENGVRLSQNDPGANFEAGLLEAEKTDWPSAMTRFSHAAALDGNYRREAAAALTEQFGRTDLAMEIAGSDVPAVHAVADALRRMKQPEQAAAIDKQLSDMLRERADAGDANARLLAEAGRAALVQHDYPAAVRYLRRALGREPADGELRLDYARALGGAGNPVAAIEEARTAKGLGARNADSVILELRLKPTTTPTSQPID